MRTLQDRFEEKIAFEPNCGCWIWTGNIRKDGYGRIWKEGKNVLAHRTAWELLFGPIQPDKQINHRCNQPWCVNPGHLYLGTQTDNLHDMKKLGHRRGSSMPGSSHPGSKLTEAQVRDIRSDPRSLHTIAKEYQVSFALIEHIKNRKAWKHIS